MKRKEKNQMVKEWEKKIKERHSKKERNKPWLRIAQKQSLG
jgi:hypothetical protein